MTLEALRPEPCWELPHHVDDEWRGGAVPHFESRGEAIAARTVELRQLRAEHDDDLVLAAARKRLMSSRPVQVAHLCCRVVCDGCKLALEDEDDDLSDPADVRLHLAAGDVTDELLHNVGWHRSPAGRTHRCRTCPPTAEELEHAARMPGPDDVPLFPLTGEEDR